MDAPTATQHAGDHQALPAPEWRGSFSRSAGGEELSDAALPFGLPTTTPTVAKAPNRNAQFLLRAHGGNELPGISGYGSVREVRSLPAVCTAQRGDFILADGLCSRSLFHAGGGPTALRNTDDAGLQPRTATTVAA
jgi:hypothetical protein